jgi:cholesterol oxidase
MVGTDSYGRQGSVTLHQYDYVIVGSGFGGSVSAMRLAEKGYSVLVIEKGREFHDLDFATTNWYFWKYLWMPALFAHGILQISILRGVMVLQVSLGVAAGVFQCTGTLS